MPAIRITNETMQAIRGAAIHDLHQTSRRQADGSWLIVIDNEVAARLGEAARSGETIDDIIQRIIRQHRGARPN